MMHGQYWDMGWTVIWAVWVMGMLLFLAAYLLLRKSNTIGENRTGRFSKKILKKRFAQGEITVDEYNAIKRNLV
ncbi:SHOCT domain-containing protein [Dyadobacter tibetensis]|uniref:SHOCT domain-containing protein n=1 Tax=Dyadobacter tibetensis TaxID=1211851 RepID=UPI00046E63A0|nr:SHOCT domain-containing protein [Dyadobacter tibetensis]